MPTGAVGNDIIWPIAFGLVMTAPIALRPLRLRLPRIQQAECPIERTINRTLKHPEKLQRHPHYLTASAEISAGRHHADCRECWSLVGLVYDQVTWIQSFPLSDATLHRLQRTVRDAIRDGTRLTATDLLGERRLKLLREMRRA